MGNLLASFPDLTFNVKKVSPKQDSAGASHPLPPPQPLTLTLNPTPTLAYP